MAAGAVSPRKSHDIIISSFCNIVKGQAKYIYIWSLRKPEFDFPHNTLFYNTLYILALCLSCTGLPGPALPVPPSGPHAQWGHRGGQRTKKP